MQGTGRNKEDTKKVPNKREEIRKKERDRIKRESERNNKLQTKKSKE
jgi:hypothetical protein